MERMRALQHGPRRTHISFLPTCGPQAPQKVSPWTTLPHPNSHQAEALLAKTGSLKVGSSSTAALQAGLMESHIFDLCNSATFHRQGERTQSLVQMTIENHRWQRMLIHEQIRNKAICSQVIHRHEYCAPAPRGRSHPMPLRVLIFPALLPLTQDGLFPGTLPPQTAWGGIPCS